jgi:AcrR family transcriptional regulator
MPPVRPRPARDRPARRVLNRAAIADAAMAILEREGLDALTMRRVAAALGTGPASLYAHVDDKEDLISVCVDRAVAEVEMPEPDPAHWQEQVKAYARSMRAVLVRHRNLARATMGMIPTGPGALASVEWLLGLLRGAGLPERVIAYAADLLPLYVSAVAFEDGLWSAATPEEVQAYVGAIRDHFAALPADRYPHTLAMLPELMRQEGDERFEFGLEVMVAGIAALAATGLSE